MTIRPVLCRLVSRESGISKVNKMTSANRFRSKIGIPRHTAVMLIGLTCLCGIASALPTSMDTLNRSNYRANLVENRAEVERRPDEKRISRSALNLIAFPEKEATSTGKSGSVSGLRRKRSYSRRQAGARYFRTLRRKCNSLKVFPQKIGESASANFLKKKDWFCRFCPSIFPALGRRC